jgi:hypothetical protein
VIGTDCTDTDNRKSNYHMTMMAPHICNEKLIKVTGPIRFLLAIDNRTSAKVSDFLSEF